MEIPVIENDQTLLNAIETLKKLNGQETELPQPVVEVFLQIAKIFHTELNFDELQKQLNTFIQKALSIDSYSYNMMSIVEFGIEPKILPPQLFYDRYETQLSQHFTRESFATAVTNFTQFCQNFAAGPLSRIKSTKELENGWGKTDQSEEIAETIEGARLLCKGLVINMNLENLIKELAQLTTQEEIDEFVRKLTEFLAKNNLILEEDHRDRFAISIDHIKKAGLQKMRHELKIQGEKKSVRIIIPNLAKIIIAIRKVYAEIEFRREVGGLDRDKIKERTRTHGAKFANLEAIKHIPGIRIPEYEGIPTSIYEKWINGENIDADLQPFFDWANRRKIMARSSAVKSEDGEDMTGAGRYTSVTIEPNSDFRTFREAIIEVYKSVNSEEAVSYRAEHSIDDEKMGVVLQEFVESSYRGFTDTAVRGVPELMRIQPENSEQIVLNKEKFRDYLLSKDDFEDRSDVFHYQIDGKFGGEFGEDIYKKMAYTNMSQKLGEIALRLEKLYKCPIEIEFATDNIGIRIYILQVRPLPKNYSEKIDIEFPKEKPLAEGKGIGAGNIDLEVLPMYENNTDKNGIVVFQTTEVESLRHPENRFPKSGAIIVVGRTRSFGGHVEMLAAERGLLVVLLNEANFASQITQLLINEKRLKLVLNGLEGRIYTVQDS